MNPGRYRDMLARAEIEQQHEALLQEAYLLGVPLASNNFHKAARQTLVFSSEGSYWSWPDFAAHVARLKRLSSDAGEVGHG